MSWRYHTCLFLCLFVFVCECVCVCGVFMNIYIYLIYFYLFKKYVALHIIFKMELIDCYFIFWDFFLGGGFAYAFL